jgi:hypothetical protein
MEYAVEQLAAEIVQCDGLYTAELEALGYWWPAPVRDSALLRSLAGADNRRIVA